MRQILATLIIFGFVGCGPKNANVTPQAAVAHYGTDVLTAVQVTQKATIAASDAHTITVDQAKPVMDQILKVITAADKLSAALKVYDAATGGARTTAKSDVLQLANALLTAVQTGFTNVPPALGTEIQRLITNVTSGISQIKLALSAGGV